MLNKITSNRIYKNNQGLGNVNNKNSQAPHHGNGKQNPSFTGLLDAAMVPLQWFERNPMMNVSLLDCTTAIGPRTYQESKTNIFAGFEALRRESSGLIVNCLIPSFIVLGVAKVLRKPIFGYNTNLYKCWANEETTNLVSDYWKNADGTGKDKVVNTITNIINDTKGVGDKSGQEKAFKDLISNDEEVKNKINNLAEKIHTNKVTKKDYESLYESIMSKTHISESIKFGKQKNPKEFYNVNFKSVLRDTTSLLTEFVGQKAYKNEDVDKLIQKAVKLVNRKSALGLGIIIPLALSMQPINRFITEKVSGHKGAPIYKDFASKNNEPKKMSSSQKNKLLIHKLLGSAAMVGVALLSMKGKLPGKKVLQFSGIFPTMDQARVISTATFVSRIMSSQDSNDCREATIRDIGTFSALYFLGDYAARAVASLIEKVNPKVKLLNASKKLDKDSGMWQKLKHWAVDTSLKSTEEVLDRRAKTMRSVCQLGNIAFSFLLLGTIIPKVTRHLTDKSHEKEMKKEGMTSEQISKYYQNYSKDNATATFTSNNGQQTFRKFEKNGATA